MFLTFKLFTVVKHFKIAVNFTDVSRNRDIVDVNLAKNEYECLVGFLLFLVEVTLIRSLLRTMWI